MSLAANRKLSCMLLFAWSGLCAASATEGVDTVATALPKFGFVVSISDYKDHPKVANAWNDGVAIASTLQSLEFNLVRHVVEPRTRDELYLELEQFRAETLLAHRPAVVVAYVAAHGFQIGPDSFVATGSASAKSPEDESLTVQAIAEALSPPEGGITILLVDACRTPAAQFAGHTAHMQVATEMDGVLVMYATKSGKEAQSVSLARESQSPFSFALDTHLKARNTSLEKIVQNVGNQVQDDVGQQPAVAKLASLGSPEVYLRPADRTVQRHGGKLGRAVKAMPTSDCMRKFNQYFPANDWTNWAFAASRVFEKGPPCAELLSEEEGAD